MEIGNYTLPKGSAVLAPMAGVADRAFRELCVEYGAGYVVSEMVSCKGITMHDRKSDSLLFIGEKERPAAIQLFGDDPTLMAKAARHALRYQPQSIDINMGCPAPKIAGNGGGSALMKNPILAAEITKAVKNSVDIPVSVKFRTGWDSEHLNAVELAVLLEQAGADYLTVHGRTKTQMYAPPVDFETIRLVKQAVNIPVIGNGDINSGYDALQMLRITGCDTVMVGRGAMGRPWIFSQIKATLNGEPIPPEPSIEERMEVMLTHIRRLCAYKGERIGMREARKHAAWYIRDIRDAAKYRKAVCALESVEQLTILAKSITAQASIYVADTE